MPRIHLTPDLAALVEFDAVGTSIVRRSRRKGGGRKQKIRRFAGEFQHDREWLLRDVNTRIGAGESVAVLGAPDSGREEFLRLAAGTLIPDEGTVRRREPLIPMINVIRALDRSYTFRQNIYIIGGLLGMTPSEVETKVETIAEEAEVTGRLDKYLGDAKPMIRQKLAWSICMAVEANAYAIDQIIVVGGEDYRAHCWERMEAKRAAGATFLLASDEPDFLLRFCDRAIVLRDGGILVETTVEQGLAIVGDMTGGERRTKRKEDDDDDVDEDEI